MRFGLILGNGGPCDPRTMADLAALAEDAGWDGVFLEDYFVWPADSRRGLGDARDVALANLGEQTDTRARAAMLDEGLDVLVGLWSGEPLTYHDRFYEAQAVTLLPRPLQRPRIPIWIGGQYPKTGPVRRAMRWDGSCLFIPTKYAPDGISQRDWTPDEVRAFLARVADARPNGLDGFNIVVGGRARQPDWDAERALIKSLANAGATWWVEWVKPADRPTMEAAIKRRPLRN